MHSVGKFQYPFVAEIDKHNYHLTLRVKCKVHNDFV